MELAATSPDACPRSFQSNVLLNSVRDTNIYVNHLCFLLLHVSPNDQGVAAMSFLVIRLYDTYPLSTGGQQRTSSPSSSDENEKLGTILLQTNTSPSTYRRALRVSLLFFLYYVNRRPHILVRLARVHSRYAYYSFFTTKLFDPAGTAPCLAV